MREGWGPAFCPPQKWLVNRAEGLGVELDPECEDALAKGLHLLISRRLRGWGGDRLWRQTRSSLSLLCDAGNYVTSELHLPRGAGDDGGVWVIGRQGAATGLCWRVLGRAVGSTPLAASKWLLCLQTPRHRVCAGLHLRQTVHLAFWW